MPPAEAIHHPPVETRPARRVHEKTGGRRARRTPAVVPDKFTFDLVSFEHIEDSRERRAKTLLCWLEALSGHFHEFGRHLEDAIEEMRLETRPRPQRERERVYECLFSGPMTVARLSAVTGYKDWKVRKLLGELMFNGSVEEVPESRHVTHSARGGTTTKLYCIVGKPNPDILP